MIVPEQGYPVGTGCDVGDSTAQPKATSRKYLYNWEVAIRSRTGSFFAVATSTWGLASPSGMKTGFGIDRHRQV